jgi:hypothetical protein
VSTYVSRWNRRMYKKYLKKKIGNYLMLISDIAILLYKLIS